MVESGGLIEGGLLVMKERYHYVDIAKGLLIFFVILGHYGVTKEIEVWIYSFHIPCFFIIGGLLMHNSKQIDFSKFITNKIRRIMVPYFVFSLYAVGMELIKCIIRGKCSKELSNRFIAMLCFDGTGVLWFLPAYFFASVLVYLLLTYYKRYCFIAVSFLLCIAYCLSWFSNITACAIWGRCFMGSVFMILGYVMAPFFQMIPNLKMRRRYLIILLCLVANILMVYMNKVSCDMFSLHYGNVLLYLGESITGSAFLILLCMNIRTYKLL